MNAMTEIQQDDVPPPLTTRAVRIIDLPLDKIEPAPDARPIDEKVMPGLMDSIHRHGLFYRPQVRIVPKAVAGEDGGTAFADIPVLIAGGHRLEACKRLGWGTIECEVRDGTDTTAREITISENLHRSKSQQTSAIRTTEGMGAAHRSRSVPQWDGRQVERARD